LRFRGLFEPVIVGKRFSIIHTSIPYFSVIRHVRPEFIKTFSIKFHCVGKVKRGKIHEMTREREKRIFNIFKGLEDIIGPGGETIFG
jgi:hypothetical protein